MCRKTTIGHDLVPRYLRKTGPCCHLNLTWQQIPKIPKWNATNFFFKQNRIVPDKKFIVFGGKWCEASDSLFWLDNILKKLFNSFIFISTESYMYAKQIKNIQLKNYQTNFEIFSRSRHLYDFPILRSRLYWLKYKTTSKTQTRLSPKFFFFAERFYDSQNMMEQE